MLAKSLTAILTTLAIFLGATTSASGYTFGNPEAGSNTDSAVSENFKRANSYKLTQEGAVSSLSVYAVQGTSWQSGRSQKLKAVIYSDSSGKPTELLGTGTEVVYKGTTGWLELPFGSSIKLNAGTYWIGFISGDEENVMGFRYKELTNSRAKNSNNYTSGPSNPFGTYKTDNEQLSLYATYTTAPVAATKAPSNVEEVLAFVEGTVNPGGSEVTECRFEYGTTISYGNSVSCAALPGSGEAAAAVTAIFEGLSANTTYHYRVKAKNANGTTYGSDEALKTHHAPDPLIKPASEIGATSAILNATINPKGYEVTECQLEWGITEFAGEHSSSCTPSPGSGESPVAVSAKATGLTANALYYFKIVAQNAGGRRYSADETFTTLK